MTTMAPPKAKLATTVKVDPKVPENVDLEPGAQCSVEPNPSVEHEILASPAETQREEGGSAQSPIPGIMNTTLDVLDDSEADLSEPQGSVDDVSRFFLWKWIKNVRTELEGNLISCFHVDRLL